MLLQNSERLQNETGAVTVAFFKRFGLQMKRYKPDGGAKSNSVEGWKVVYCFCSGRVFDKLKQRNQIHSYLFAEEKIAKEEYVSEIISAWERERFIQLKYVLIQ